MDNFNIDFTLNYIKKIDQKLIDEMDNITFEYNKLSKEGDKLLQILNYSPKVSRPDRKIIENQPAINIPQLSELKTLDFSILDSKNNIENISSNRDEKEKKEMIKDILFSIIDNVLEKYNNNSSINSIKTDEDAEETFIKLLIKNKNKSEYEEKKIDNEYGATASKLGLEMNLLNQIKVYLFNNNDYILINITSKDKKKYIKEKIIKKIIDNKKCKLSNTSEEAYEIRPINEDNEDKFIMGSSPLENNDLFFKEKIKAIAFLENQNYISEHLNEDEDMKIEDDEDEKINVKIYYKKNGIKKSKLFVLSKEETLKNILNTFFDENIFKNKNIEHYYFIEHNAIEDIENEITLDTNIKHLKTYELNLLTKDNFELPEIINEYNVEIKKGLFKSKNEDIPTVYENSRFNEISGGLYQEFEVIKINKYKNKKKRILGIDMYNLYNNLPKNNNNGLMNMIFKETKHPVRKIENIKECIATGKKSFYIDIKDEDKDHTTKLKYETKSSDIRDEIVDKINFLINYHKNNN
jgi:hypothetical protein